MEVENEITNRVATSGLVTIDLEEFYSSNERYLFDLRDNLYNGLILKEKDFREFVTMHNWSQYSGKNVAITCTEDAIIPNWAYMLVVSKLAPYVNYCFIGSLLELDNAMFQDALARFDPAGFLNAKVVIKGCSKHPVPAAAYGELTRLLMPFASSIMYGEPCSTVPVYKRPK
jgi:hypothetical protein